MFSVVAGVADVVSAEAVVIVWVVVTEVEFLVVGVTEFEIVVGGIGGICRAPRLLVYRRRPGSRPRSPDSPNSTCVGCVGCQGRARWLSGRRPKNLEAGFSSHTKYPNHTTPEKLSISLGEQPTSGK